MRKRTRMEKQKVKKQKTRKQYKRRDYKRRGGNATITPDTLVVGRQYVLKFVDMPGYTDLIESDFAPIHNGVYVFTGKFDIKSNTNNESMTFYNFNNKNGKKIQLCYDRLVTNELSFHCIDIGNDEPLYIEEDEINEMTLEYFEDFQQFDAIKCIVTNDDNYEFADVSSRYSIKGDTRSGRQIFQDRNLKREIKKYF